MYVEQLISFFVRAGADHRIGPYHVALYVVLFEQWCINNGKNPISVGSTQIRQLAKMGRTSYHKYMRELEEYGYITYVRSYSPVLGSLVSLEHLQ